jgi:hypothetical protein
MLLPRWAKKIVEAVEKESSAVQEALKKQEGAIRDTEKATDKKREEIGGRIVSAIVGLHAPADERTDANRYRKKAHRQQIWLTWGTWLAFLAAGVYAGIAARQLHTMRRTFEETQRQTYMSCLTAQAAQRSAVDAERNMVLSQAVALSSIEQATAETQTQRAFIIVEPHIPTPDEMIGTTFAIPFKIVNLGKSTGLEVRAQGIAIYFGNGDVLDFHRNLSTIFVGPFLTPGQVVPAPEAPPYKAITAMMPVVDSRGVQLTYKSQGFRDLFNGDTMVMVIGRVQYRDFAGTRNMRFCAPMGVTRGGHTHYTSPAEINCYRYTRIEDESPTVSITQSPAESTNAIPEITCKSPSN